MKWFYNLKIGAKLILSFILVALIAAMVGIVGIVNLKQIEKSDKELYENMTVPIALLADISTDFQRIRVNLRDMIIAEEIEEINSKMDRVNELRAGIDEKATEYEKLILSDAMRTAYDEFLQTRKNFSDQITVVYNLAKDNKDNEALGIAAEDGAMGIASRAEQDAIAKLVEMKINDAHKKANENEILAQKAMLIMIIIVAAAILLAIVIGLFLTKVITKPMKLLIGAADKLSVGDINVNVKSESKDETGMLLDAFAKMIANIEEQAKTAELISVGNFGMNITPKSSNDVLNNSMKKMKETLVDLVAEVNSLTKAGADGKLDIRGNLSKFAGGYKDIIAGINNTLDAVIGPLNVAAEYVDRISKGDIPPKITDTYNGDFNEIKNNLNVCIDAVNALVSDANMLAQAAIAGKLDTRADANKHYGDFRKIVAGVNGTLDSVIGPLNVAAEYVDRISKGDIPPKITDTYNGDFNEIKNNLNVCIDAVNALVSDANMLAQAAIAGKLDTRADANKHYGDFRKIVAGVNGTLDAVIGPLNVAAEYVDRISKGDIPPKITDTYNGDFNEIKNNLNVCIDAVNALVSDANMLAQAAIAGKLDTRADANKHYGDFRNIVAGVNGTLDAVIGPLNVAAEYVDRISKGDIPPKITDTYNGDFNEIKNNLNVCIDAVNALVSDANMLAQAAIAGKLDTRADANKHYGDFRNIVAGVNGTLDSVIGPLNVAAEYVDRISKGDIPPKITDTYNGDFNEIKNNLNVCIDAVNALVSDANMLAQAAIAGKLDTRADANKHYGDFRNIVTGVNGTLDAVIGPLNVAAEYVDRISKGDIPPKITDTYNGDFNEIKNNLNVCIDAVNALVSDANMLAQAAIAGKLDTRADANKHYGDFRNIVTGVNGTLDAVILPVKEAAKVLTMMANGNLKARVTGDYKGDHAEIKNALNSTLDSIGSVIQEITYILNEMANSNLDVKTKIEYKGDFEEIKEALDLIIESLNDVLGDVNAATDQVASGSRQLSNSSMSLSQGATEQASSIEELTASIEEISAQTNQNAENANKAKTIAETAKSNAVQGNTQMQGMLKAMSDINESSNNISKIIKVIDEIAFQTNILALNAAVEAARAGKHGKGFAVVAEEVRNLAARSANAAKETTGMIEDSILKVADGTKIANETANALNSIVSGVSEAANLVSDIAVASNEQAIGVEQVNQGLMQISDVVQTTSATSEETAAASEELSGQAEMLKSKVMNFKLKRQKNETKFVESEKRDSFSSTTSKKNKSTKTISLGDDFKKY